MRGLIVTEASQQVGAGHLMECLAIAECCPPSTEVVFDGALLEPWARQTLEGRWQITDDSAAVDRSFDWILVNTRRNETALQLRLRPHTGHMVVLDELGNIELCCDHLINFSPCPEWHAYTHQGLRPSMHLGPRYFPLRRSFLEPAGRRIDTGVLVSLGGTDPSRSTLRVAGILAQLPHRQCTYVLGPGSDIRTDEILALLPAEHNHQVIRAPKDYQAVLAGAELLVCCGGNTLYEAAYLGIPTLVVWEMKHEKQMATAFSEHTRTTVIGDPDHIDSHLLLAAARTPPTRQDNRYVDGLGTRRIADILNMAQRADQL